MNTCWLDKFGLEKSKGLNSDFSVVVLYICRASGERLGEWEEVVLLERFLP